MPRTQNGVPYPDAQSPYPSALWWKALAEALDPFVGKLAALPDLRGLYDLLAAKIDRPAEARTGQVLTFNGDTWVAWDPTGGGDGGGGSPLPISQKGAFLVGTGTDWIVLPGGTKPGDTLLVDPMNGYGYKWGSPLPAPGKGKLIAGTPNGWVEVPAAPKNGLALVSDDSAENGVRWGTELPTPSKGSVLVADGTKWLPLAWSGRPGDALLVDLATTTGLKWGGVLPSPLKGALLVGDGVTWRLMTPAGAQGVLTADATAPLGLRWSTDYVRRVELEGYVLESDLVAKYVRKDEIDKLIAVAIQNRWTSWQRCRLASGWSGSLYAAHDGTMCVLRGELSVSGGAGNTMAYLPDGFPSIFSAGLGTHLRTLGRVLTQDGQAYPPGNMYIDTGVRPSYIEVSGHAITTHGTVSVIDNDWGVKLTGCTFMMI